MPDVTPHTLIAAAAFLLLPLLLPPCFHDIAVASFSRCLMLAAIRLYGIGGDAFDADYV